MKNNVPYIHESKSFWSMLHPSWWISRNHVYNLSSDSVWYICPMSVIWWTELPGFILCDYEFISFMLNCLQGGGGCQLLIIQISNFWKLFLTFCYKYLIKCWCFIFQINSQNFPNKKYFPTLVFCCSSGLAGRLAVLALISSSYERLILSFNIYEISLYRVYIQQLLLSFILWLGGGHRGFPPQCIAYCYCHTVTAVQK